MIWVILHGAIVAGCALRILLCPHRQPESRLAWLVAVMVLPYAGALAYLLLGETSIERDRAAHRGIAVRAMVDDLGSRAVIISPLWARVQAAGVQCGRALAIGNPLRRVLEGRIDNALAILGPVL